MASVWTVRVMTLLRTLSFSWFQLGHVSLQYDWINASQFTLIGDTRGEKEKKIEKWEIHSRRPRWRWKFIRKMQAMRKATIIRVNEFAILHRRLLNFWTLHATLIEDVKLVCLSLWIWTHSGLQLASVVFHTQTIENYTVIGREKAFLITQKGILRPHPKSISHERKCEPTGRYGHSNEQRTGRSRANDLTKLKIVESLGQLF